MFQIRFEIHIFLKETVFIKIYLSNYDLFLFEWKLISGDLRVNQSPDLAVVHTIFTRHHNLLVSELAVINPQWDDERLFQEARRILVEQSQHISYNEYLPIILGISF